jgi:hypothetical protein
MADQVERGPTKRPRGTMAFPYADLDDAVSIARAVWEGSGLTGTVDRVAARTGHQNTMSGAFRNKVNAARLFGLVTTSGQDVALTDLGREMIEPRTEVRARATAFRHVELFDRLFDRHRGRSLPVPAALEEEMVRLGVVPNQRERARQVFMRSAEQAGYFAEAPDRLIEPAAGPPAVVTPSEGEAAVAAAERSEARPPVRSAVRHPLIEGLFTMLPVGGSFTPAQQRRWLEAAKVNLALVYGNSEADSANDHAHPEE